MPVSMLPKAGPKGIVLGTAGLTKLQLFCWEKSFFPYPYLYMYVRCLSKIAADNYLAFSVSTCVCSSGRFFRFIVIIISIHIIHFTFSLHYCEIVQGHNGYNDNKRISKTVTQPYTLPTCKQGKRLFRISKHPSITVLLRFWASL